MKKGEKKKQQKALARRAERKSVQRAARASTQANPILNVLRHSRSYPLLGCWTQPGWDQNGLALVVVARRQPDGLVVFGTFLVDYYCLGVKDAYCNADVPYTRFLNEQLPRMLMDERPLEISPDLAHELIYGSVEYAARWGFRPHADFKLAQQVLDPSEAHPQSGQIQFGKDGMPFYVSGPHDNVNAIMRQLARTAGEGHFHFLTHLDRPPFDLLPGDDEDIEE
jgi:hypothetical protein